MRLPNYEEDWIPLRLFTAPKWIVTLVVAACLVWIGDAAKSTAALRPIPCDLTLSYGTRSEAPSGQFHLNLVFANNPSDTPCRVFGFPKVELIGPIYPTFGSIYVLPDQAGASQSVILRPGQTAHSLLTWLPGSSSGHRWIPGYIRVVVPSSRGGSFAMALPWRYGSVLRQDGASHPGTYIGPVRRGAR